MTDEKRKREYARAIKAYGKSNESRWVFNFFASRIVGTYGFGGTRGLADDMSVSPDTVENGAHAFWIFDELRNLGDQERIYVNAARKLPYIHYSHFRELYDLKIQRNLSIKQIMDLLIDVVQAEGTISSRSLSSHANEKYGDTRDWTFYAGKTQKELLKLLQQPDLPDEGRKKAQDLFSFLGDMA